MLPDPVWLFTCPLSPPKEIQSLEVFDEDKVSTLKKLTIIVK